jgi:hypothetical protein
MGNGSSQGVEIRPWCSLGSDRVGMWIRSLCYIAQIVTDGELSVRHRWFEVGDGDRRRKQEDQIDRLMWLSVRVGTASQGKVA